MKILIAFFSLTGNTRFVAEKIAEKLSADLCEIIDKKHKKGRLIYLTGGYAALREKQTKIEVSKDVKNYDLIVVGSPIWAGKIAPAIRTFQLKNDFSNKKRTFFETLAGENPEKSFENMKQTTGFDSMIEELVISKPLENMSDTEKKIVNWCNNIKKSI